jgi:hypothetical protein
MPAWYVEAHRGAGMCEKSVKKQSQHNDNPLYGNVAGSLYKTGLWSRMLLDHWKHCISNAGHFGNWLDATTLSYPKGD